MEDLRVLLKKAVHEQLSDQYTELADKLVDVVCASLDAGGDSDSISNVVETEANNILGLTESTLSDAEKVINSSQS